MLHAGGAARSAGDANREGSEAPVATDERSVATLQRSGAVEMVGGRSRSSAPLPVYAVVGADRLLRAEAVAAVVKELSGHVDALGPTRVEGASAELAEVLDELRTQSLLGDLRVVIVDEADPFISAHRAKLEAYCENPAPSGSLILACRSLPRTTRLYKAIERHGRVIAVETPKGRGLVPWLIERAERVYGKRLERTAAGRLCEQIGAEPGMLDAELSKLAAYVGKRSSISAADVDALTGHLREEKVFAVTDAMAAGDVAGALRHWEQVLATDRAAPGRAIAGLAWGVRRLLQAKRDFEGGVPAAVLARRMYMDPAALERRLRAVSIEALERQQHDLLAADLAVKTGGATLERAVETFIVKHSTGTPVPA
ncbi:MAG: DNA polymerase III subunit delta [Planctomycetota bacterium]|nr:MAG: DNA polymerase III subunit delta [Planctomycetota bacterium]